LSLAVSKIEDSLGVAMVYCRARLAGTFHIRALFARASNSEACFAALFLEPNPNSEHGRFWQKSRAGFHKKKNWCGHHFALARAAHSLNPVRERRFRDCHIVDFMPKSRPFRLSFRLRIARPRRRDRTPNSYCALCIGRYGVDQQPRQVARARAIAGPDLGDASQLRYRFPWMGSRVTAPSKWPKRGSCPLFLYFPPSALHLPRHRSNPLWRSPTRKPSCNNDLSTSLPASGPVR